MSDHKVVVVGAGAGGLAAAVDLARRGLQVTVVDRAQSPGGKIRLVDGIDAGPTVFTMRWAFEGLFGDAGERLENHLELTPITTLARHTWRSGATLDLFSDVEQTAEAIAAFASPRDAQGFREFCARGAEIYGTLLNGFIASERPSPKTLIGRVGLRNLDALWRTMPFTALWDALDDFFVDPRLRQLFGRYSTYVGSSPMLAPATLMLIAHVERTGLYRVTGGMHRVAQVLHALAESKGARFIFGCGVKELLVEGGRASGVLLENGERLSADSVVFNGDVSALGSGLLGPAVTGAARATPPKARGLSAITWCARVKTSGRQLLHHNVFFADDYENEFDAIFRRKTLSRTPTVYVCAQDRDGHGRLGTSDPERLLLLINAPATGDTRAWSDADLKPHQHDALALLAECGLRLDESTWSATATSPTGFDRLFPATGGALYGRANHGFLGSFERSGNATAVPGLYAVGGSVHPGPGVPMAILSGRLCAARLVDDRLAGGRSASLSLRTDDSSERTR